MLVHQVRKGAGAPRAPRTSCTLRTLGTGHPVHPVNPVHLVLPIRPLPYGALALNAALAIVLPHISAIRPLSVVMSRKLQVS